MGQFRPFILKVGLVKSVMLITVASVLLSILLTYGLVNKLYGYQQDMPQMLLISALVPMIIAPLVSFNFIKLLFKIEALERETRYLATYDELTGLFTRRAFYEHAEKQLAIARRESQQLTMLVADLDGFKLINDTYGHQAGDEALKHIASVIKQTIREADIAGRVGGDEFIFCLPNASSYEAETLAQRLVECVRLSTFMYQDKAIQLSMSVGLADCQSDYALLDECIKQADTALYRAKHGGKNQVAISVK